MRRAQIVAALMMAFLMGLSAFFENSGPELYRWLVPACVPLAVVWGWMLHRALNVFGGSSVVPDEHYAVRVAVAVPVAVGCALVAVAVSTPTAVSFALPLVVYWMVAEPLLWSRVPVAVGLRRSAVGARVGGAVRSPRGQRTLRAVGLALLVVGPTTTLLRDIGVGSVAPYIGFAVAVLLVVAEITTGDDDDQDDSAGHGASGAAVPEDHP